MLLDLRERIRNSKPIKYTLITIISIPFALVGIGSYFSGGELAPVATVDGQPVSLEELDALKRNQRAQMSRFNGGVLPAGVTEEVIEQSALEELLRAQSVRNVLDEHNFQISDTTLAQFIQRAPEFQTNGVFDKSKYDSEVGRDPRYYEERLRIQLRSTQLQDAIRGSGFLLPQEQERINELATQVRLVDTVRFPAESVREGVEVSDEEAQAWFDENQASYVAPERVKLQYIQLSPELLMEDIDVTDEDAQANFDSNRGLYMAPEQRAASHILLETDGDTEAKIAELNALKERIEAGEDFGELAKEFSADIGSSENGGSLGQFGRGTMVGAFEDTLFAMTEEGALSDPVETDFGVHLIRLDEIVPEAGKPFEEVKDEIVQSVKRTQANLEYGELLEILKDETFNTPESLDAAAEAVGREVVTTDWIDGTDTSDPLLSNPLILQTALSDDVLIDGNNSAPFEISENNTIALRTIEHEEERPRTLDEVREQVVEEVTAKKVADALAVSIQAVRERLDAGETVEAAAEAESGDLILNRFLARSSRDLDVSAMAEIFRFAKPADDQPVYGDVTLADGDAMVVVLREVLTAEEAEAREQAIIAAIDAETGASSDSEAAPEDVAAADDTAATQTDEEPPFDPFNAGIGEAEYRALLRQIRNSAEVSIDREALQQDTSYGGGS